MSGRVDLDDLYRRQLPRGATVNARNQLRIVIERRMTPAEAWRLCDPAEAPRPWIAERLSGLGRSMSGDPARLVAAAERHLTRLLDPSAALDAETRSWTLQLRDLMAYAGKPQPEPFRRDRIATCIIHCRAPGRGEDRTLTIVFTGGTHRPMMPLPVFLQHLDARRTDVLVLWDPSRSGYRTGLPGSTSSLAETIGLLRDLSGRMGYGRIAVIGTSLGGFAAMTAGLALGAATAVTVGGGRYGDERRGTFDGVPFGEALAAMRAGSGRRTRLVHVHGRDAATDRANAAANVALVGGEIRVVGDTDAKVGHNALIALVQSRRFGSFLADMLDGTTGAG